jgi:hypothetical protein
LHQRITASVRLPQPAPASKPGWFSGLLVSPVARFSFAAAAGVLFSLVIFNAAGPDIAKAPGAEMAGSMIPRGVGEVTEVLDQMQLTGAGFAAGAVLLRVDEQLILNISLDATRPVDISVGFENSGIRFESIGAGSENLEAVRFDSKTLHLRGTGNRDIQVLLDREQDSTAAESATIQLEFSSDGLDTQRGALGLAQ